MTNQHLRLLSMQIDLHLQCNNLYLLLHRSSQEFVHNEDPHKRAHPNLRSLAHLLMQQQLLQLLVFR